MRPNILGLMRTDDARRRMLHAATLAPFGPGSPSQDLQVSGLMAPELDCEPILQNHVTPPPLKSHCSISDSTF